MHTYSQEFFSGHLPDCQRSAQRIVPRLIADFAPASVLDVGCGDGTWLAEFARGGVADVTGVDGPYVDRKTLLIPPERFVARDLAQPLELGRRFDLVTSFEVGEHLPPEAGAVFVASLVRHAPLVVFSASVPGQFGEHHVNEQWPRYWVNLFAQHGYACFDILRARFWTDEKISWWYRQNMLVFAAPGRADTLPVLAGHQTAVASLPLDVAHPRFVEHFRETLREDASIGLSARKLVKLILKRARNAIGRRPQSS